MATVDKTESQVAGMGPAAALVTLTYNFVDFVVTNPELARIINSEGVADTPRLEWMVENYVKPLFERWGTHIDRAKEAGLLKDIPTPFVMSAFLGGAQYFFDLAPLMSKVYDIKPKDGANQMAYANAIVEMFLEGASARGDEEPPRLVKIGFSW